MGKDLQRSIELLKENEEQVRRDAENALYTICRNVLSDPKDRKFREIKLDDPVVTYILLPALGAIECLLDVGFTEATDCFSLPDDAPLDKLQALSSLLMRDSIKKKVTTLRNLELYNLIPWTKNKREENFFKSIVTSFEFVLQYENPELQEKAKRVMPIVELEIATMKRIRHIQKLTKLNNDDSEGNVKKLDNDSFDAKDLFLMELLHWFKYKFFTWVDTPKCTACFSECKHYKTISFDDDRCSRVEIHKCTKCDTHVKFPRYNDPEPLLTLRRGRCGEWANVFTLLCRALGYDARFVLDQTDHVWTEVWSIHRNKWIHLDPCEDVMDRPLMYEKGWKKRLSYVIAFSKDEVQDVTWRYTRDQLGVLKRRTKCSEARLLQLIESLNNYRQSSPNYRATRKQYVTKRKLLELVELIHVPNEEDSKDDEDYHERSTGSYEWKLARGEVSATQSKANHCWDISKYGVTFHFRYSIVKDVYEIMSNDGQTVEKLVGWENGIKESEGGVFRKVETDWKVVYLSRSPGTTFGKVRWCFTIQNQNLSVKTFNLKAVTRIFHEANVSWEVEAFFKDKDQESSMIFPVEDSSDYCTHELRGSVKLIVTATISGGQGNCAWQHAQLFREDLTKEESWSFAVDIELETS